jgi:hypothetical protein
VKVPTVLAMDEENEIRQKLEKKWKELTTIGLTTPGVIKERNPLLNPPDWYDPIRYKKAQQMAKKYFLR